MLAEFSEVFKLVVWRRLKSYLYLLIKGTTQNLKLSKKDGNFAASVSFSW